MNALKVKQTLGDWMTANPAKLNGVFLTHMHIDHLMGGGDLGKEIPIYTGTKESTSTAFINMFVQGSTNDLLGEGKQSKNQNFPMQTLNWVFLLQTFWRWLSYCSLFSWSHSRQFSIFSSQHKWSSTCSRGYLSYYLRLAKQCSPGDFTADRDKNRNSLNALQLIAKKFKDIKIHPGHQSLKD